MEITINIPDDKKETKWSIPFNELETSRAFFYIQNTGEKPVELECISISCTQKASYIIINSVLGEAEFTREDIAVPVNKNTWRNGFLPEVEAFTCYDARELTDMGQLDRLDMPQENTTYKMKSDITIGPNSIIVLSASTEGKLSGIVTISQEIEEEE